MLSSHTTAGPRIVRLVSAQQRRSRWLSTSTSDSAVVDDDSHDDYFRLLGVERQFDLPQSSLKARYRKLMSDYHPDRHGGKPHEERTSIERVASEITNAYETLKEPQTRAMHLLDLVGHPLDESSSGNLVGNKFLMTIMEVRESVESTSSNNMAPLLSEADSNIDRLTDDIGKAFDSGDYPSAVKLTARLKYWCRIKETVREKMEDD